MLELRTPAKINIGLEICARRADGYHEIDTLFLPIRLYDLLALELLPGADGRIELEVVAGPGIRAGAAPADARNLAWRAARAGLDALGVRDGLRMRLEKRIPVAAGLGGGSSDAAAVLLGLEQLTGRSLPAHERASLALSLGADVPFFLDPRPARGRGLGEKLEPIPGLPELWWVLATLPVEISTAEAYRSASSELTLPRQASSIAALLGPSGLSACPPNDLEAAATRWHPEIAEARRALQGAGAIATGMSGSGPTVFGNFASAADAERAAASARLPEGSRAIVVSSPGSDFGP